MSAKPTSAKSLGLVSCHDCRLLVPAAQAGHGRCPRCGAGLHARKPNSIARAWAFLLAAAVMYVPANILPMTITTALGAAQADTIMSGVIYFIHSGSWEIAAVIFIASIFVPMAKLVILIFLLVSVKLRSRWRTRDRTVLYRMTELVGRWSMVDVYVVTILVALVKLGKMATIVPGISVFAFGGLVLVMAAAITTLDPPLLWERLDPRR